MMNCLGCFVSIFLCLPYKDVNGGHVSGLSTFIKSKMFANHYMKKKLQYVLCLKTPSFTQNKLLSSKAPCFHYLKLKFLLY